MVAVDLGHRVDRDVIELRWGRQQPRLLFEREQLSGPALVLPWVRCPARTRHHPWARRWVWAISINASPAKKLLRTNGTVRSTRGVSCGERTRPGRPQPRGPGPTR